MKIKSLKTNKKAGAGKVVKGLLLGSVLGATVGWLTAPAAGEETRRRLQGDWMSMREKAKTAEGNIESQARELAQDVRDRVAIDESSAIGRKHTTGLGS